MPAVIAIHVSEFSFSSLLTIIVWSKTIVLLETETTFPVPFSLIFLPEPFTTIPLSASVTISIIVLAFKSFVKGLSRVIVCPPSS